MHQKYHDFNLRKIKENIIKINKKDKYFIFIS